MIEFIYYVFDFYSCMLVMTLVTFLSICLWLCFIKMFKLLTFGVIDSPLIVAFSSLSVLNLNKC